MRAAVLAVVALATGVAHADAPPRARTAPLGFSHAIHDADVAKANAPALACTRCHAVKAGVVVGKPNHASCFGGCHGAAPTARDPVAPERMLLCNPCHAESALLATPRSLKALAVPYPPYTLVPDRVAQLGHATHAAIACAQCHDKRGGPPHRRCLGCHDGGGGKGFAITACERCHPAATEPVRLAPSKSQALVTTAFAHARHATRGAARQCLTCHAGVSATDARELPRPAMQACAVAGCHDGSAAFGVTAACTKCHKDVPRTKVTVARPDLRFSHATHEKTNLPCATCHVLAKSGETLVAGHAACAPCHAKDFGEREPRICGACHAATEPWRRLVADRLPAESTEFGATLAHDKHLQPCVDCHSLTTTTSELRPPRGHVACSKAGCHATTGGPAPPLAACDGCHQRGLADTRERARLAASWSVRAAFEHEPHRTDKGRELACTACHTDLRSPTVLSLATPAKATCARCHDGQAAFKLTGTSCTRCHLGTR